MGMVLAEQRNGELVQTPWIGGEVPRYDVIVAGLGTAGAIAAIAAARMGLKVLGIDRLNCLGGTGTAGMVAGYYYGSKGGLYEEIDGKVGAMAKQGYLRSGGVNPELKKFVLEKEALEAGVDLALEGAITGVIMEGNQVHGLRWFTEQGFAESLAKVVIDCTADAHVCSLAGCALRQGREMDGQTQPYSNVIAEIVNDKLGFRYTDNGYVDPRDARDLSEKIIESATMQIHLREKYDDQRRLVSIAPLLGLREGPCIVGEENVSLADFLEDKITTTPMFYAYANIDNHGKDVAFESEIQQDWSVVGSLWGVNFSIPVSYKAMIPKGYDGLLAAGRHIAVDHDIASAIRMKRDMQKCGEAAAIVAYSAITQDISVRDVCYRDIEPLLRQSGCLDERNDVGWVDTTFKPDDPQAYFTWRTDPEKIKEELSSERPGIAIWSAYRLGAKIQDELRHWLEADNEHLRKHSAFVLGLLGDPAALPVLRQTYLERDEFIPSTSRKYNHVRGYVASYLLGKLKDDSMVDELIKVLNSPEEFAHIEFERSEFIEDREEYYFQYFSHALMALVKIGEAHPDLRPKIAKNITARVFDPEFSAIITLKAGNRLRFDIADKIRNVVDQVLHRWGMNRDELLG